MRSFAVFVLLSVALVACGPPTRGKSTPDPDPNNGDVDACGNGAIDEGESCDSAIAVGEEGACPTSCAAGACGTVELIGSAATCDAVCEESPAECGAEDGCCPTGCDSASDADCTNTCGDGVVEGPEKCDGDCPTSCPEDACAASTLEGSADDCSAECVAGTAITACADGDGCCPADCAGMDDDCTTCEPTTCEAEGRTCGALDDGCGTTLDCGTCGDLFVCLSGSCQQTLGIGEACAADRDCNGSLICATEALIAWPDGYCTAGCTQDSDCGEANNCGGDGVCVRGCEDDSQCRQGYRCHDFDGDNVKECAPYGSGSGDVGDACDSYADCAGDLVGFCIHRPTEIKDGYCTVKCSADADCPTGSHCPPNGGNCLQDCTDNGDCRGEGYACDDIEGDGDKECFVSATGTGQVGDPCVNRWDCGGGSFGGCIFEDADGFFSGGYCTLECGANGTTCTAGSSCYTEAADPYCLKDCSAASQCRNGYDCLVAIQGSPGGQCVPNN